MAKVADRATSRYAREALTLFGRLVRAGRIDRGLTAEELAERAGVSRGLLHRLESGHPGVSLGVAFEIAAIVGIPLFETDRGLAESVEHAGLRLRLLPKAVRAPAREVKDDF